MLLTIEQLSERWQVSPDTVRRHIQSGELLAINIGTGKQCMFRISEGDADAFINSRMFNAKKPTYSLKQAKMAKQVTDHLA